MFLVKWKHKFFREWSNKQNNSNPIFCERKSLAQPFETYKDAEEITKKIPDIKMKIMEVRK